LGRGRDTRGLETGDGRRIAISEPPLSTPCEKEIDKSANNKWPQSAWLISHSVDRADGRGRGRQEGEGIWATQEGRWETGEGRRVCQWGRVLLGWGMASCCHAGAVHRSLMLSFVEIQEVRRGGAGACRDVAERHGRGVAEGPQQGRG